MCTVSDGLVLGFLIISSLFDCKTKRLPIYLLVCMSIFMLFLRVTAVRDNWLMSMAGLGIGLGFWVVSRWTKEAIGYGDSWIILLLGGYLGAVQLGELLAFTFFAAGLFSLGILIWKKYSRGTTLPLVPFLTLGFVGVMLT